MELGGRVETPRRAREYTPRGGGREELICERERSHSSWGVEVVDEASDEEEEEYFVDDVRWMVSRWGL